MKHVRKNRIQVFESIQPRTFKGTLSPHQLRGCQWLLATRANNVSVILADEMGLGKTATTIAYLLQLFEYSIHDYEENAHNQAHNAVVEEAEPGRNDLRNDETPLEPRRNEETPLASRRNEETPIESQVSISESVPDGQVIPSPLHRIAPVSFPFLKGLGPTTRGSLGPHLIICPSSVMVNWMNEIKRFAPSMQAVLFRPSSVSSNKPSDEVLRANIVIANTTTFERKSANARWLFKKNWESLIIDEAHDLKNSSAIRFTKACKVKARHRVLLTGTPVQNNVQELITLLRFVVADSFLLADAQNAYITDVAMSEANADSKNQSKASKNDDYNSSGSESSDEEYDTKNNNNDDDDDDDDEDDEFQGEDLIHKKIVEMVCKRSEHKYLQQLIDLFVLRRTKSSVSFKLPPKTRIQSLVEPTTNQKKLLATAHFAVLNASSNSTLAAVIIKILGVKTFAEAYELLKESPMAVVGQLSGLITDSVLTSSSSLSSSLVEQIQITADDISDELETVSANGWSGKVMSVMKKIALHPLLVRSRYSIEDCLEFTTIVCNEESKSKKPNNNEGGGGGGGKMLKRSSRTLVPCEIKRSSSSATSFSHQLDVPTMEQLTMWATQVCKEENDTTLTNAQVSSRVRILSRQAMHILGLSDLAIHSWVESLPRSAGATHLMLPNDAFLDSGKMSALLTILSKHSKDDKVLVFSQYLESLDIVERILQMNGEDTFRVDGATDILKRQGILDAFTNDISSPRVMLLSTRTGGVGLNLSRANIVVFLDPDWSAQVMLQAEDRSHRMGQTKSVTVYRLCTRGSFEEHIQGVADDKARLSDKLLREPEKKSKASEELTDKMLQECLR
jgi:SNF2 family DNA or RNA helicase